MLSYAETAELSMAICATAETLGQTLSAPAAKLMAEDLAEHPMDVIANALWSCRRELTGKLTLASILQRVQAADGRPGKDEAWATADDFDGVDVEYFDETTWQIETIECRLPGDAGLRTEKIKIDGVSTGTRAWRIGMRRRRQQVYQRKSYSFSTELDALNSGYLDYALLGDTTPGYGQSAMLKGYALMGSQHLLVSSERLDWSSGGEHWVALRRQDGSASGPYVASRIDDYRLTITGLDFTPVIDSAMDAPVLQFGPKAKFCYPALIKEVSPSGTVSCNVTAVNYDERVYADDNNFPPA